MDVLATVRLGFLQKHHTLRPFRPTPRRQHLSPVLSALPKQRNYELLRVQFQAAWPLDGKARTSRLELMQPACQKPEFLNRQALLALIL